MRAQFFLASLQLQIAARINAFLAGCETAAALKPLTEEWVSTFLREYGLQMNVIGQMSYLDTESRVMFSRFEGKWFAWPSNQPLPTYVPFGVHLIIENSQPSAFLGKEDTSPHKRYWPLPCHFGQTPGSLILGIPKAGNDLLRLVWSAEDLGVWLFDRGLRLRDWFDPLGPKPQNAVVYVMHQLADRQSQQLVMLMPKGPNAQIETVEVLGLGNHPFAIDALNQVARLSSQERNPGPMHGC